MEHLKRPQEFSHVYNEGKPHFGRFIVVSILPTNHKVSRVGFAVSKKHGNAVVRNTIKRRLRAIVRELGPDIDCGFDFIIGAKRSCVNASFQELQKDVYRVLQGSGLLTRIIRGKDDA